MALRKKTKEESRGRRDDFEKVASAFKSHRPALTVLKSIKSVPTPFVQFDHATKIGGFPLERFCLVHGPSGQGKSKWVLGLIRGFLARDHAALYIDAERTTPREWVDEIVGPYSQHPLFFADRPEDYESTMHKTREWLSTLTVQREKGNLHEDTSGLIIVDSIRKLVPKAQLEVIMKDIEAEKRETKESGKAPKDLSQRIAQRKAAMNAGWMDELIPLLERAHASALFIAREMIDPNAMPWAVKAGQNYVIGGGGAMYFDASLVARVERGSWISDKKSSELEEGERATVYGEKHKVTIRKTKVGGHENKVTTCYFNASNGVLTPKGLDRARDVVELAQKFELVKGTTWLCWGKRKWQGMNAAVKKLTSEPQVLDELEAEVRACFMDRATDDQDVDT